MLARGGVLRPLLVMLLLLNVAHALLTELGQRLAEPGSSAVVLLDDALRQQGRAGPAGHGAVQLLPQGPWLGSRQIIHQAGAQGSGYYEIDISGQRRATASAMGTDKQQHIVNAYLVGFSPYTTENLWEPLLTLSRRKHYQYDHLQYWGWQDVWQTSAEAFQRSRGDCEDHALALADWLIGMGEDARVVVGSWRGGGHAWVVMFHAGQEYLFEATQKEGLSSRLELPLARYQTDYRPAFMFNRDTFWSNTGSTYTTRYSGPQWQRTTRYRRDQTS